MSFDEEILTFLCFFIVGVVDCIYLVQLEVIPFGPDLCFTAYVLYFFLFERKISEVREILHIDQ